MSEPTLWSQWPHVTYRLDDFDGAGYGTESETRHIGPLPESNIITSEIAPSSPYWSGRHTVALDIDWPAVLVPSSTPGHSHLYIDCPMTWDRYEALLRALSDACVIEHGYAEASIRRKHTSLRLPWVRKKAKPEQTEGAPF